MRPNRLASSSSAASAGAPERILAAGLEVFAEHGYEGAKMRKIARRAGVPLGLLQYHFGGKLKLWQAAVDHAFAEIRSDIGPEAEAGGEDGDDGLGVIRAGIRAHVRYVAAHPEFVSLMYDEGKRRGPRMRWIVDRHTRPMFEQIGPMMGHLQSIGRLPADVSPEHFVYALIGAINTIFHQAEECRRITGADPRDPAQIEAHARAIEWLFLGPPKADASG